MINIVVPIVDKPSDYTKCINEISSMQDVNVLVGVTEQVESLLNLPSSVVVKIFNNLSKKEEIINSLQSYLSEGRVVVARRPFTKKELERIINSKAQITYFENKTKSGIKEFFKKGISSIIKLFFGVDFFDGDISLIGFDEDLSEVLRNVKSLSYSTRVDRWRGVEHDKVESEGEAIKLENSKKSNIRLIITAVFVTLIPVLTTIFVSIFVKVGFIVGMLLFCFCLLGVCGSLFSLCSLYFNKRAGQRYFDNAKEIN